MSILWLIGLIGVLASAIVSYSADTGVPYSTPIFNQPRDLEWAIARSDIDVWPVNFAFAENTVPTSYIPGEFPNEETTPAIKEEAL